SRPSAVRRVPPNVCPSESTGSGSLTVCPPRGARTPSCRPRGAACSGRILVSAFAVVPALAVRLGRRRGRAIAPARHPHLHQEWRQSNAHIGSECRRTCTRNRQLAQRLVGMSSGPADRTPARVSFSARFGVLATGRGSRRGDRRDDDAIVVCLADLFALSPEAAEAVAELDARGWGN